MGSIEQLKKYTASFAFFEALWEAGVTHVFANLGSDHPSIMEAMVKGQKERQGQFPRIITCPNEMVALSMADGFARLTNKPQCVIVHVDVGTQGLAAAVHNASCGRCPVLIFAGLSPYTIEGEYRGSRTEYIHWIQDVPDQKQIVAQYCRYTGEIKAGRNVKQMVNRALQFATSDPQGPVYLCGAREPMEEEIEPYHLDQAIWHPIQETALSPDALKLISTHLASAKRPLMIVGYTGRNPASVSAATALADLVPSLHVLDTGGCDMCFPADHPASLGLRYGVHDLIPTADFILVVDCDVPWIPTQCKPSPDAKIIHIDVDPLKQQMPVFYIPAFARYRATSATAFTQIVEYLKTQAQSHAHQTSGADSESWTTDISAISTRKIAHETRLSEIDSLAALPADTTAINPSILGHVLKKSVPDDAIYAVEAVTLTILIADQLLPTLPKSWINCGGGGLGWSGGAALGIKLASDYMASHNLHHDLDALTRMTGPCPSPHATKSNAGKFITQIVGDGTFLFSVPSSVYWISNRYDIPILTIVLNNKGWNAPRRSLLLVHPDGEGSKVDNKELNISFEPMPDFAGIAKASSGGKSWAGVVADVRDLEGKMKEAVEVVKGGRSAVLEVQLGVDGKPRQGEELGKEVKEDVGMLGG